MESFLNKIDNNPYVLEHALKSLDREFGDIISTYYRKLDGEGCKFTPEMEEYLSRYLLDKFVEKMSNKYCT